MAPALFFAALASFCLGHVVESLICRECLMEIPKDGCLFSVGFCKAVDACKTFIISSGKEVDFRVRGCFVSKFYPCGMKKSLGAKTLSVKCCSQKNLCNEGFQN